MDPRTKIMLKAIDEFEAHFNFKNRAIGIVRPDGTVDAKACAYVDEGNNFCGHSFFLTDEVRNYASKLEKLKVITSNDLIHECLELGISPIHRDEYSILDNSFEFWQEIQEIHDDDENFTEEGISDIGKELLDILRQEVKDGEYS